MKIDWSSEGECWSGVEPPWLFIWNQIWTKSKTPQRLKPVSTGFMADQTSSTWHPVFAERLLCILLHKSLPYVWILWLILIKLSLWVIQYCPELAPVALGSWPHCVLMVIDAWLNFCLVGLVQVFIAACGMMKLKSNCILERSESKLIKQLM